MDYSSANPKSHDSLCLDSHLGVVHSDVADCELLIPYVHSNGTLPQNRKINVGADI